jgi:hypothetical protein
MVTGNLVILAVIFIVLLWLIQRTERKRIWVALLLLLPGGYLIYRWAVYRDETRTALAALGIGAALNLLYWLLYGRKHPPGSSDSIRVIGMED